LLIQERVVPIEIPAILAVFTQDTLFVFKGHSPREPLLAIAAYSLNVFHPDDIERVDQGRRSSLAGNRQTLKSAHCATFISK
jgi:hypothetical protein